MNAIPLCAARSEDFAAILALNNAHAAELGALTLVELERLIERSFRTRVAESVDAFLIAFEQGVDYESPNYRWFGARFERFAYVDRVAVAATARKKGLGRLLYRDIIDARNHCSGAASRLSLVERLSTSYDRGCGSRRPQASFRALPRRPSIPGFD